MNTSVPPSTLRRHSVALLGAVALFGTTLDSEARRENQTPPPEPPPPSTNPLIVPVVSPTVQQQVQVMSARLTLLNGVFYSKYATVVQP